MRLFIFARKKNSHIHIAIHTAYWYGYIIHSSFIMKSLLKVSSSKDITVTFSTEQLFFIVTCLLKLIRLDKSNFKYNYRIYKLIDEIYLQLFC